MTSRGIAPLTATTSSPGSSPARCRGGAGGDGDDGRAVRRPTAAGEAGRVGRAGAGDTAVDTASEATAAAVIASLGTGGRRPGAARRAARLLRRRGDGDQGAGVDGPQLRAARVLLPRDRPQQARRRALRRAGRGVRRRHRRRPAGPADHALGPRLGARGGRRRPRSAAPTSSTRCARWSPRCTTRSRCAPARATASSTSATRATRRRSARWPSRRSRSAGSRASPRSTRCPAFDEPVALLAQTTLSHRDWADVAVAVKRRFPDVWMPGPQRPVLRHDQPPVGADGAWSNAATRSWSSARRTRRTPGRWRSWRSRAGVRAGVPRQRRRRAARRPRRHRRRHRRRVGTRGARRRGDRPAGAAPRRRGARA